MQNFSKTQEVKISDKKVDAPSFVSTTLKRLLDFQAEADERLKVLQVKKYQGEIQQLTDRPHISPKSKKLCPSKNIPLYIRSAIESKEKDQRIDRLRKFQLEKDQERFFEQCTFSPNYTESANRTHQEIVQSCYKWSVHRTQNLKKEQAEKEKKEISALKPKPTISKNSQLLSQKRSITPLLERLTESTFSSRPLTPSRYSEFHPSMNKRSKDILRMKEERSFVNDTCKNEGNDLDEENNKDKDKALLRFHDLTDYTRGYKVNTSRKTITKIELNEISYEQLMPLFTNSRGF